MTYLSSTIGRKQLVGLAGLGLSLFVLVHMAGNLLILVGPEVYNKYAHTLTSNPLIYVAEAGLVGIFLLHVLIASFLTLKNKRARNKGYAASPTKTSASFASRTVFFQGMVIFIFVIWHLISFKFGPNYPTSYEGTEMRDLYQLMEESFSQLWYIGVYYFVLLLLGLHLGHGLASSLQTLGLNGDDYDSKVKMVGKAYSFVVTVGFMLPPLYIFMITN
jgi:succinate dehydrogenase / fumarate reductase cytochrome b subunit